MDFGYAFRELSTCDLSDTCDTCDTCDACDACDALGIDAATTGAIKSVYPDANAICGPYRRNSLAATLGMRTAVPRAPPNQE